MDEEYALCRVAYCSIRWCFILSRFVLYFMVMFFIVCVVIQCAFLSEDFVLCFFFIVSSLRPVYQFCMSWGLAVNADIRKTQYSFMWLCMLSFVMCVSSCACVCICRSALVWWNKYVKAHRIPKIDIPHGKERGRERGEFREDIHIYETKGPDSRAMTIYN